MSTPQPQSQPPHLAPKRPPGRSNRKVLHYACDVRRLRAEGHTLESIRQALLDAGVSVSVSTVRREVARVPSQWELDREQEADSLLEQLLWKGAAVPSTPSPQLLDASSGEPTGSTPGMPVLTQIEAIDERKTSSTLTKFFGAVRGFWRTKQPT